MAYDPQLEERVQTLFARRRHIVSKKMFGGVGFLFKGNMCVGIWKDSLIARIGPEAYATALREPFVREFDITGRAMTGWVLVEPEGLTSAQQLKDWINRALDFVETLPAK